MSRRVQRAAAVAPGSRAGLVASRISRLGLCLFLGMARLLPAQEAIRPSAPGGQVRLLTSDAAILEAQDTRKDLPCAVTPAKPSLGFDLKFHSGYDVAISLKELAGTGDLLTIVFRIAPEIAPQEPAYFSQHVAVPAIDEEDRGPAFLQGAFNLGEGKYHVDWLMRDRTERVCSSHWDSEASLPSKDKPMALDIAAGAVQPEDTELFRQEPPVPREPGGQPDQGELNERLRPSPRRSAGRRSRSFAGCAVLSSRFEAVMDSMAEDIYFKDRQGRFTRVNRAMATHLGLSDPARAIGRSEIEFFCRDEAEHRCRDDEEIVRRGRSLVNVEEKWHLPGRSERWLCTTNFLLRDSSGAIVGSFGISRDITERKRFDAELEQAIHLLCACASFGTVLLPRLRTKGWAWSRLHGEP